MSPLSPIPIREARPDHPTKDKQERIRARTYISLRLAARKMKLRQLMDDDVYILWEAILDIANEIHPGGRFPDELNVTLRELIREGGANSTSVCKRRRKKLSEFKYNEQSLIEIIPQGKPTSPHKTYQIKINYDLLLSSLSFRGSPGYGRVSPGCGRVDRQWLQSENASQANDGAASGDLAQSLRSRSDPRLDPREEEEEDTNTTRVTIGKGGVLSMKTPRIKTPKVLKPGSRAWILDKIGNLWPVRGFRFSDLAAVELLETYGAASITEAFNAARDAKIMGGNFQWIIDRLNHPELWRGEQSDGNGNSKTGGHSGPPRGGNNSNGLRKDSSQYQRNAGEGLRRVDKKWWPPVE